LTTPNHTTPSQTRDSDAERRAQAQARRPLISKWAPNVPTGYISVDDAIEYMKRRWGSMIRPEMYEAFSRDDAGPKYTIMGDWPNVDRGARYYMFEDIDLWVYRSKTGVPSAWVDIRKLPKHVRSTVPVVMVDGETYGEEQRRLRGRVEEDGRRRAETARTENSDAGQASDGSVGQDRDGSTAAATNRRDGSGSAPTDAGR
jgi:hypothetical protein